MDTEAIAAGDDDGMPRPIGAILAAARHARGLDLTDVARDTRVPVRHLAAIEADAHDNLPALPYAIGFVKAFARVVGVDPDMAGAQFRAETNKAAHVPVAPAMTPLDERRLPPRGLVTASVVAVIAVVALIVAWSAGVFDRTPATQIAAAPAPTGTTAVAVPRTAASDGGSAVPSVAGPATPPAATAPGAVLPGTPPAVAAPTAGSPGGSAIPAAAGGVVITASEDAWFRVSVYDPAAGKVVTVKTGVLAKGEHYTPPATPGLRLWTGRAGALAITVDGRPIPPLGGPVETVKNVSLDPADLRARISGPAPVPGRAGPPVG